MVAIQIHSLLSKIRNNVVSHSTTMNLKAGSHRNDYERIQLKTDLRLVKIIKSKGKHFHICLKHMFANNFVKLFFIIHNFSLS